MEWIHNKLYEGGEMVWATCSGGSRAHRARVFFAPGFRAYSLDALCRTVKPTRLLGSVQSKPTRPQHLNPCPKCEHVAALQPRQRERSK